MRAIGLAALMVGVAGCVTQQFHFPLGDLTLIANRNVPAEMMEIVDRDVGNQVCGQVGPNDFSPGPTLSAAIDEVQRMSPGSDALANVDIELIQLVDVSGKRYCIHVRGDAVRFRGKR